jgi:hypothetical protein
LDKYKSRQIHYTKFNKDRDELETEAMEKLKPVYDEVCNAKLEAIARILGPLFKND